jgi:hypothetical protein
MQNVYSLLLPLFLLTCLIAACGNGNEEITQGMNGTFTATLNYPDGSTHNFVADSIVAAFLAPTNDTLLLRGMDKAQRAVSMFIIGENISEGQTITATASTTDDSGFFSAYDNLSQIPYIFYMGSMGEYGTPDQLNISNLDAADRNIAGTFELTTYQILVEYDADSAVEITNGQFDVRYFTNRAEAAEYFDFQDITPTATTNSVVNCNISSTLGTVTRNNFELITSDNIAVIAPTLPQNLFTLTFSIGNNYQLAMSCTAATGSHTINEFSEEGTFYIVADNGATNAYSYFANNGVINLTAINQTTKTITGNFTASGIGASLFDPDAQPDPFEASGSFTVQYP